MQAVLIFKDAKGIKVLKYSRSEGGIGGKKLK
jgi:hypothetical protein